MWTKNNFPKNHLYTFCFTICNNKTKILILDNINKYLYLPKETWLILFENHTNI